MARRTWWLSAVFGVAAFTAAPRVVLAAESLPAEAIAVRVHETLHAGCPTDPSIFDRLKAHLPTLREAYPGEQAIALDVRTEVRERLSFGMLTITIGEAHDERVASSVSCADVLAALSMMAAIVIGEDARASAAAIPVAPVAPAEPAELPARRPPRRTPPAHSPPASHDEKRVRWSLGAGAEVDVNRGSVLLGRWFAGARLPLLFDPTLRLGVARSTRGLLTSSRGDVTLRWSVITFDACAALYRIPTLSIGPCFDSEVGTIDASVVDPAPARNSTHFWLSAGASGKVAWQPVGALSVELAVGFRIPVPRSELFFEPDRNVIYRSPVVIPAVMTSIVAHFPE